VPAIKRKKWPQPPAVHALVVKVKKKAIHEIIKKTEQQPPTCALVVNKRKKTIQKRKPK